MGDRSPNKEAKFEAIVESATEYAIFSTDDDGVIDTWNAGAERVFGYTAEEARGTPLEVIFTPEDRAARAPAQELAAARSSGSARDKRWHVRKDGAKFWADGHLMRIDGAPGFVKIVRDLTSEKRAERMIQESEERFSRAFLANPVAMAFVSREGRFSSVNEAFLQLTGHWRSELVGATPDELTLCGTEGGFDLQNILGEDARGLPLTVRTKDGEPRGVLAFARQTSSNDEATLLVLVDVDRILHGQ